MTNRATRNVNPSPVRGMQSQLKSSGARSRDMGRRSGRENPSVEYLPAYDFFSEEGDEALSPIEVALRKQMASLSGAAGLPIDQEAEWQRCTVDEAYFIDTYCRVYDTAAKGWIPFKLWDFQRKVLKDLQNPKYNKIVILKARQLGLSWLCLADDLWTAMFRPIASIALFSRREDEAKDLLKRVVKMFSLLPEWMRDMPQNRTASLNTSFWRLGNGSEFHAFPTTAGDSYQFTKATNDEFDLVENQSEMITAVEPTIENGGQMVLVSRSDKKKSWTYFKRTFLHAVKGETDWHPIFLAWDVHPHRTKAWYRQQCKTAKATDGNLDKIYEQYPATYMQALQGNTGDKRIPHEWIEQCYKARLPMQKRHLPAGAPVPHLLQVWELPKPGVEYVCGADSAEGNPTSDPSALHVGNKWTGEQVAVLSGKFDPYVMAEYSLEIAKWYNQAGILPERNGHGQGLLAAWEGMDLGGVRILKGKDGKAGWNNNRPGKVLMYTEVCDILRTEGAIIHDATTWQELGLIEGDSLSAPDREHDDNAVAFCLMQLARSAEGPTVAPYGADYGTIDATGTLVTVGGVESAGIGELVTARGYRF